MIERQAARAEREVFADLAALCCRPGYVHALAIIFWRDNMALYTGPMKEVETGEMFSRSRLIRTEINTLLGLVIKTAVDWTLPAPATLQEYVDATDELLEELHQCLAGGFWSGLTKEAVESGFNPFDQGAVLREPIFYSAEAAYSFQYLELAVRKYRSDAQWLLANRGFTIDHASRVAKSVEYVQAERISEFRDRMRKQPPEEWTLLPVFTFAAEEIAAHAELAIEIVHRVLSAFELPTTEHNERFNALYDPNAVTATPLLRMPSGEFLSLQAYSLAEAIYEAPHHWMYQDEAYCPTLSTNRGDFAESFVAERLRLVFGEKLVHLNVDVFKTKSTKVPEVDVLVVWGNRVIIVQTKSKRLKLESRRGNIRSFAAILSRLFRLPMIKVPRVRNPC